MKDLQTTTMSHEDVRKTLRSIQTVNRTVLSAFHEISYHAPTWSMATWLGIPILKHPSDLMMLQETIWGLKPALIIETGTAFGGSALYMAHMLDYVGHGEVITIDLNQPETNPTHHRIRPVKGSSVDPAIVSFVEGRARNAGGPVMVILDSDHHEPHVSAELAAYADLVTPGSFLVVEDTNVNGHPILPTWGPGPAEAVDAFLETHPEFVREILCERYLLTMHPGGWLRKQL